MTLQTKVMIGTTALYFADKSFDAVRDHFFGDLAGDFYWLLWAALAGVIALALGVAWVTAHKCAYWWKHRKLDVCPINATSTECGR